MIPSKNIQAAVEKFQFYYNNRLGASSIETKAIENNKFHSFIKSAKIKDGNYPRIFHHGRVTKDVIILTHGLSDSPYYMEAVAKRFFSSGLNVILPLLPAHGLKRPDKALEDLELDTKWREQMDDAVAVASMMGKRISLGGFSTGGALSFNKILRNPAMIAGGLFLFSGAIDVGLAREASRFSFVQRLTKITDGTIQGIGPDPYKYPKFPYFGAIELSQIIRENRKLSKNKKISQPVFAAHSVHDEAAKLQGIIQMLEHHVEKGVAYVISEKVSHANLPLDADIPLKTTQKKQPENPPLANPQFEEMMKSCLSFFKKEVQPVSI